MITVKININKDKVYDEVAQTTSYTGAKMDGDEGAYERIFTTDSDRSQLERFWNESRGALCQTLKNFLESETEVDGSYELTLSLSSSYDTALNETLQKDVMSFFVLSITAKWFVITNKQEATGYAASSAQMLESVLRKVYHKKRPRRES